MSAEEGVGLEPGRRFRLSISTRAPYHFGTRLRRFCALCAVIGKVFAGRVWGKHLPLRRVPQWDLSKIDRNGSGRVNFPEIDYGHSDSDAGGFELGVSRAGG